jgi:23S rRNA (cytidine2498-2'-O)-methyltransferase
MTPATTSQYLFALCNPGAERALKQEAAAGHPDWRPGYQRRGFVTFKSDTPFTLESLENSPAFARRLCLSLGKAVSHQEAAARIEEIEPGALIHRARFHERKMQGIHAGPLAPPPALGTAIGTIVELASGEFWAGLHRHHRFLSPDPAGDAALSMPAESPSRAWLKLEEAARFFDLEFHPTDIVVELGCAPGGVVLALIQRKLSAIGVDPATMAPVVMAHAIEKREVAPAHRPWFFHCRKPAALASKRDLGQGVTWFMSDMNQSPKVVLKECARFCRMAPSIRGVLITLKLTDLSDVADKETWISSLREMGFRTIKLQQLAVHHRELVLLGLR